MEDLDAGAALLTRPRSASSSPPRRLPGTLITGAGVGLTLPTFMATGAASLPPQSFATGSAVINMPRQVSLAVGVAVLIAVLGSPHTPAQALSAFQARWAVIATMSLRAAAAGAVLLRTRPPRIALAPTNTVIPAVAYLPPKNSRLTRTAAE